jgi:hypothetical protein
MNNNDTERDHGPGVPTWDTATDSGIGFLGVRAMGWNKSTGGTAEKMTGGTFNRRMLGRLKDGGLGRRCWMMAVVILALAVMVVCPGCPGKVGVRGEGSEETQKGQEEVIPLDDWAGLQTYALEILDPDWPPGKKESPIRVYGVMGEGVSKELIVYNFSPRVVEDVVLRVGLSKLDRFPPTKLPAPVVFTGLPESWRVSPRQLLIGRMDPEERVVVNITASLEKVGRYRLLLIATGDDPEDDDSIVLRDAISLELEKVEGHSLRISVVRLVAMAMLALCGGILINKRRG